MSSSVYTCQRMEGLVIKQWEDYIEALEAPKKGRLGKSKPVYTIEAELRKKLFDIMRLPFTTCSREFYDFLKKNDKMISREILLQSDFEPFLLIESYLRQKTSDSMEELESCLQRIQQQDFDRYGISLFRSELANGLTIKKAYPAVIQV